MLLNRLLEWFYYWDNIFCVLQLLGVSYGYPISAFVFHKLISHKLVVYCWVNLILWYILLYYFLVAFLFPLLRIILPIYLQMILSILIFLVLVTFLWIIICIHTVSLYLGAVHGVCIHRLHSLKFCSMHTCEEFLDGVSLLLNIQTV